MPATNNRTEQAIGKSKMRFKMVRGFKSMARGLAEIGEQNEGGNAVVLQARGHRVALVGEEEALAGSL